MAEGPNDRTPEESISILNSPNTNRKNAGVLLRRMSDDFNQKKFPHIVQEHKRRRASSTPSNPSRWRVTTSALIFLRRLTQSSTGTAENSTRRRTGEAATTDDQTSRTS